MNKKSVMSKLEFPIVVISACLLVFGITIGLGTINSGWHLVDDHQFFYYLYHLRCEKESLLDVIISELIRDYSQQHRARLLFYPCRVPMAYLWGFNIVPYEVLKSVEAVIALVALYFSARELKLSRFASALFTFTAFCGPQSAVWWKLGTPQLQCTMSFALGFCFMIRYLKTSKRTAAGLSIFFYFIMVNFHESFLVLIPFLVLFVIYYGYKEEPSVKVSLKSIWEMAKKRIGYICVLCAIFAALMIYIIFFLGVNSYGSVDTSFPLSEAIKNWAISFKDGDLKFYFWFGILLVILLATYFDKVKSMWMEMIMFVVIILPQLLLYSKEGFYERYLLPLTIGWALLFVVAVFGNDVLSGYRKRIYSVILVIMVFFLIRNIVIEADYYRFRGQGVTAMLNEALEVKQEGFNVATSLGADNPEADDTMSFWMRSHGEDDCWYWNSYFNALQINMDATEPDSDLDISDVDLFITFNRDDRHFVQDVTVDLSSFNYVRCGTLDLYYSDRAYADLTQERLDAMEIKPTIYGIGE